MRSVLGLVVQDHPNRASTDLRGIWGNSLRHGSILSRIGASGKPGTVQFVSRSAFDKLATLVEGGVTIEARAAAGVAPVYPLADIFTTEAVNTADTLWAKIEVGTVVLAAQPEVWGPGWWEGIVVSIDGDNLTLRWMETPAEEPFQASRRDVALRHPSTS